MTRQQITALEIVSDRAETKRVAQQFYREALIDARKVGCTFTAIGDAAGIARTSAQQLIARSTAR